MADFPTAAVNRLSGYNGARYDAQTNPLGMAIGGHRVNFPASLNDSASVTAYMAATSQEVKDAATAVAANLTATNSARSLAQAWASRAEDQVVSGGLLSSFHYAMKAAASALAAQQAQGAVENTRDNMLRRDGAVLAQGASLVSQASAGSISDAGVFAAQLAGFRNGSASGANGAIVFKAPSTLSTVMARFIVEGHNWSGDHVFTINATAYRTSGAFSGLRKLMLGTQDIDVRFALTPDGRMALILGDVGTQWGYINLSVSAMFSQQPRASLLEFSKGWTTEVVTSLSGYTQLTSPIANTLPVQVRSELNLKADLASPAFTDVPTVPTPAVGTDTQQAAPTNFVQTAVNNAIALLRNSVPASYNTLKGLYDLLIEHTSRTNNPHNVTAAQTGAVAKTGDTGMSGRFVTSGTFEGTLVHNAGYFDIQSFSTGTYGSGLARFWYNPGTRTIAAGPQGDGSGRLSLTGIDIDVSQAIGAVPDTRSITAGNGLTGGGSLAANRTVTLGTPGTLTATTSNAVQTAGHTHNVDAASVASVGNTLLGTGGVGTYALMRHINNAVVAAGASAAGASLRYASAGGSGEGTVPAGTWRCMGFSFGQDAINSTTLYMRIA